MLGETTDNDLVQWTFARKNWGVPARWDMIIKKAQEIHWYMFGFMRSVGSVGCGWCYQFMVQQRKLTLRMAQVIKRARNEASLEGLGRFFCELCQHMIERKIKKEQFVEYGRDWLHSESKTHAR